MLLPTLPQMTRFPLLAALGYSVAAYQRTIKAPRIVAKGRRYYLVVGRTLPTVLFSSVDRQQVDWIDFSIELVVGLVALITGFNLGRQGYNALRPVIDDLYENDELFRELVHTVGEHTLTRDALETGKAIRNLWMYIWRHYRKRFFDAVLKAVGGAFTARALFEVLVKWMIRLISAGAALLMEIGELAIPLNNKLASK